MTKLDIAKYSHITKKTDKTFPNAALYTRMYSICRASSSFTSIYLVTRSFVITNPSPINS